MDSQERAFEIYGKAVTAFITRPDLITPITWTVIEQRIYVQLFKNRKEIKKNINVPFLKKGTIAFQDWPENSINWIIK